MPRKTARRIPATEVKTHFGRIVQEVAMSNNPVIVQSRGHDQAVIISLRDFQQLSSPTHDSPALAKEQIRDALRAAQLLSEPAAEMRRRADEYDARHTPERQEEILAELRNLRLEPSLSDVIRAGREWHPPSPPTGKR